MFKEQRQQEIIDLLKQDGYATVEQLSKALFASPPTIRRDLTELAKKRLISRSHGGAMIKSEHNAEVPIDFRNTFQTKAKASLAKEAANLISDGDVIYIDASTTSRYILNYIKSKKDLTIITNSIQAAFALRDENVTVYSTGGKFLRTSLSYAGSIAESWLDNFNINIMFFSAYGLLENGQIQDYSEPENSLRLKAIALAEKSVFLCDQSKLGKKSLFNVTNISNVDYFITDADLPKNFPSPKIQTILCEK